MQRRSNGLQFNEQSKPRSATHDVSRVSYHVKEVGDFAQTLEEVRLSARVRNPDSS
jgi:hypothetical protein